MAPWQTSLTGDSDAGAIYVANRLLSSVFRQPKSPSGQVPKRQLDTVGKRLAWARRQLAARQNEDIPPAEIARRLDVPTSTVTRWENDERIPDSENIFRLAGALQVDAQWLRTGEDAKAPPNEGAGQKPTVEEITASVVRGGEGPTRKPPVVPPKKRASGQSPRGRRKD